MLIIAAFIVGVALSVAVGADSPHVGTLSPHPNDNCELTLQAGHVPGRLDPVRTVSCDPDESTAPGTPDPADPISTTPPTT